MRTLAPAKINWTLEVLGRRDDGYHEIRSVMQTIDLCDEIWVERAEELRLEVTGNHEASEEDLALKAARLLAERVGRELPALIRIAKRIPVAAGLGGGSSDAAAVLLCLDHLYELGRSQEELAGVAAGIGSDVPFFVFGGTALAEGRGERITPLQCSHEDWLVVAVLASAALPDKTQRMYESLREGDFTDGSRTENAVAALRRGEQLQRYNVFQGPAQRMFDRLPKLGDALTIAGARSFDVAGSGPAIYAQFGSKEEADAVASDAGAVVRGFDGVEAELFVARTIGASEATAVRE
jgi:4-diphosphocytidyl-2-C-methyl-D-erythritol kinase